MAAIGALEAGEAGGEVATAEEGFDCSGGGAVERAQGLAVFAFVVGEECVPAVVDELPEGRGGRQRGRIWSSVFPWQAETAKKEANV